MPSITIKHAGFSALVQPPRETGYDPTITIAHKNQPEIHLTVVGARQLRQLLVEAIKQSGKITDTILDPPSFCLPMARYTTKAD